MVINDYKFIYNKLLNYYGPQQWWPADTTFEMLIGSILVQNTNWRNVEKALDNLKAYLYPEGIATLSEYELAQLIKSSGYYNLKAQRIKSFMNWFSKYDYNVDALKQYNRRKLRTELLNIKGIGRETADVMLLYAFDQPVFVADAYARRIFGRFGMILPHAYDHLREDVEGYVSLDWKVLSEYHALLVAHAKQYCKKKPICMTCPLLPYCKQRIDWNS